MGTLNKLKVQNSKLKITAVMLATGVSLNSSSLLNPKHNGSTSTAANDSNGDSTSNNDLNKSSTKTATGSEFSNDDEIILEGDDNSNDASSTEMMAKSSRSSNDSKRKVVDINNNTDATALICEREDLEKISNLTAQSIGNQSGVSSFLQKLLGYYTIH